jgi:glycolate oxidase FAD binding subunit
VRDHVLGLQILNGRAELLTFGGQVMKNVAGYDLSRLMVGAMGTLGLITQVSLKVLPCAAAEETLQFEIPELGAIRQLNRWMGQPLPLDASACHDRRLWVRLRGAQAAVQAAKLEMGGEAMAPAEATAHWKALRDQTAMFFVPKAGMALWRLSLPDTAPPLAMGEALIEWHGAQRWMHLPLAQAKSLRERAAQLGGHATVFRSATPVAEVFTPLLQPMAGIQKRLKAQFDPHGLFNPGRLFPNG